MHEISVGEGLVILITHLIEYFAVLSSFISNLQKIQKIKNFKNTKKESV